MYHWILEYFENIIYFGKKRGGGGTISEACQLSIILLQSKEIGGKASDPTPYRCSYKCYKVYGRVIKLIQL